MSRDPVPSPPPAPTPPPSGYTFTHLNPRSQSQPQPQPQPQYHPNHTVQPTTKLDKALPPRYLGYHLTPRSQTPHDITFQYASSPSSSSPDGRPDEEGVVVKGETVEAFEQGLEGVTGVEGWLKGWVGRSLTRARGK